MTTTRQQIAARRNPPKGVARLKADNRTDIIDRIAKEILGGNPNIEERFLMEAAFEAGRRYPARGAKGRAR